MNKAFFSVIMPVFNDENHIKESIESVLKQTFIDFELIIIDDCSTDNTFQIIESFPIVDSRVKFFSNKENIGLTKSLNNAVEKSCGTWIVRQDSDDISLPNRLSDAYSAIKSNNFDFYSTPAISFSGNKKKIIPSFMTRKFFSVDLLKYKNCLIHGTLIINRDVLMKIKYHENFRFSQDFKLYHELLNKGFTLFYNSKSISYKLRSHDNRSSNKNKNEQLDFFNQVLRDNNLNVYSPSLLNRIKIKLIEFTIIFQNLLK